MYKFALYKIEQVKGRIPFFKLVIDGRCAFDEFCNDIVKAGNEGALKSLLTNMDSLSNNLRLPPSKYKELRGRAKNDRIKDFEFKKNEYRVYGFVSDAGDIIVFGGKKTRQERDIARLREIKKEYFNTKRNDNQGRVTEKQ